jgi:hypothetical protein
MLHSISADEDEDQRLRDALDAVEGELEDEERGFRWLELADSERLTSMPHRFSGFIGKSEWADHCRLNSLKELGWTVLHYAASNGDEEQCTELLEQRKIPVDMRDVRGNTPLHLAAAAGYHEVVKLLCEHGASICARTKASNTPIMLARDEFAKISSNNNHKRRANRVDGQDVKVPFWFQQNELQEQIAELKKEIQETKVKAKSATTVLDDRPPFSVCIAPPSSRRGSNAWSTEPICNLGILVLCLGLWEMVPQLSRSLRACTWWEVELEEELQLHSLSLLVVLIGAVLFVLNWWVHQQQCRINEPTTPADEPTCWPAAVSVTSTGMMKLEGYRVAPGQKLQVNPGGEEGEKGTTVGGVGGASAGLLVVFEPEPPADMNAKALAALPVQLKKKTRDYKAVCETMKANKRAENRLNLSIKYLSEEELAFEKRIAAEELKAVQVQHEWTVQAQHEWIRKNTQLQGEVAVQQEQEHQYQQQEQMKQEGEEHTPASTSDVGARVPLGALSTPENISSKSVRKNNHCGKIGTPGAACIASAYTPRGRTGTACESPACESPVCESPVALAVGASVCSAAVATLPQTLPQTPNGRVDNQRADTPKDTPTGGRIGRQSTSRMDTPYVGRGGTPARIAAGNGASGTPGRGLAATRLQLQYSPSLQGSPLVRSPMLPPSLQAQSPSLLLQSPSLPQRNRLLSLAKGSMGMGTSPSRMDSVGNLGISPPLLGMGKGGLSPAQLNMSPARLAPSPGTACSLLSPQLRMLYEVVLFVPDGSDAHSMCDTGALPTVGLFPTSKVAVSFFSRLPTPLLTSPPPTPTPRSRLTST